MRFLIMSVSLVLQLMSTQCHSASNLAPALNCQAQELVTQAGLYQTNAANLILVDEEINLNDQTKTTLQAYLTPCANVITQVTALKNLLVSNSNKQSDDPTIATDSTQFQQMLIGLNSMLNVIIPNSNLSLQQTQTINFARSNLSITLPHFDVEWSSIYPMSFTTNTQAETLATTITPLVLSMTITTNNIQFYINNLIACRGILVSVYNSYIAQMTGYFSLVSGMTTMVPLTNRT